MFDEQVIHPVAQLTIVLYDKSKKSKIYHPNLLGRLNLDSFGAPKQG